MPLSSVAKVFGGIISKRGILLAMAKNKFTKGMSEMIWNDCYSTIPGWNPNLVKYSKNNCSKFPPQILQLCVLLYEPTCCMGLVAFQLIELNFSQINPPLSLSLFFHLLFCVVQMLVTAIGRIFCQAVCLKFTLFPSETVLTELQFSYSKDLASLL